MSDNVFCEMLAGYLARRRNAERSTCPWKGSTADTQNLRKWWLAGYDCEEGEFNETLNQLRGPSKYQIMKEKFLARVH